MLRIAIPSALLLIVAGVGCASDSRAAAGRAEAAGDLARAANLYDIAREATPEDADLAATQVRVLVRLAAERNQQGQVDDALQVLGRARRIDPRHVDAALLEARIRRERGDDLMSIARDLEGTLAMNPGALALRTVLVDLYEAEGNDAAALEHLVQCVRQLPDSPDLRARLQAALARARTGMDATDLIE